jgi:hypothetical protein
MDSKQLTISDFENWFGNFPDSLPLKFTVDGVPIEWTGGSREAAFDTECGKLSKVNEIGTVEFRHGPNEVPQ